MQNLFISAVAALSLSISSAYAADDTAAIAAVAAPTIPAGTYTLDKTHASLVFSVNHMGFSNYTASFKRFDAKLQFDPAKPADSKVEAVIDPTSLELNAPPAGFTEEILGQQWLNITSFPKVTFTSTKIEVTGAKTGLMHGDFTLHGVTHPVVMNVTFNGGYDGKPMEKQARVGFSARGSLKRSEFGVTTGIPAPGSNMGVGDEVQFVIEAEFTNVPAAAEKK